MSSYKFSWSEIEMLKQRWNQFAKEQNGSFRSVKTEVNSSAENTLMRFEMRIPYMNGEIFFVTNELRPLKVKYEFFKYIGEEFLIHPEDYTDKIAKLFVKNEIELGIRDFDKRFILKSDNKDLMTELFDEDVRKYLTNSFLSNFKLETKDYHSVLEINLLINELNMKEVERLLSFFQNCISKINEYFWAE